MTALDLDALQAAAEAATPGLWFSYCPDGAALNPERATFVTGPKYRIMDKSIGFSPEDGAYIAAARPQVIRALIDRLRKAEAAREGWKLVPTAATPEWVENLERKYGDPDACEMSSEAIAACINELLAAAPTSADSEGAKG